MLLDELPDGQRDDRRPWLTWSLARWELYRADQIEALKRAEAAGQPTDILRACVKMADFHLARRIVKRSNGERLQVVRDVEDLW